MNNGTEFEASHKDIYAFQELKNRILKDFGPDAADDGKISRFLTAKDFDVEQGYIMLKKHIEWRRKYKIDTILEDFQPSEIFTKYFPLNLIGFDMEGSPALLMDFGTFDYKGFYKSMRVEEFVHTIAYYFESWERLMREQSKAIGREVGQFAIIANLEELSFTIATNKVFLGICLNIFCMFEANYPERLKVMHNINAPKFFKLLFAIFKRILSAKTMDKTRIYGKDDLKEAIFKHVDPLIFPAFLGGKRTDPDGNPMCKSVICHGGPVPEKYYYMKDAHYLKNQGDVQSHILRRRSKLKLPFEIQNKNSVIKWEFETENYDVGFGLFYKDFNTTEDDEELRPLIPLKRISSYILREGGNYVCELPGIYILMLDNSYSFFRSKKIYYKVSVLKADEIEYDPVKKIEYDGVERN